MARGRVEMDETWEQLVARTGSPKAALKAAAAKLIEQKRAEMAVEKAQQKTDEA